MVALPSHTAQHRVLYSSPALHDSHDSLVHISQRFKKTSDVVVTQSSVTFNNEWDIMTD